MRCRRWRACLHLSGAYPCCEGGGVLGAAVAAAIPGVGPLIAASVLAGAFMGGSVGGTVGGVLGGATTFATSPRRWMRGTRFSACGHRAGAGRAAVGRCDGRVGHRATRHRLASRGQRNARLSAISAAPGLVVRPPVGHCHWNSIGH